MTKICFNQTLEAYSITNDYFYFELLCYIHEDLVKIRTFISDYKDCPDRNIRIRKSFNKT